MSTNSLTKNCQNCKEGFTIEPDDFGFYEQMKVPPPVWCPHCRRLRRLNWYSYRIFYKRKCDFTGENIITTYHPSLPYKVYKQDVWWSDKWDPKSYGKDYDFSRPFFEQFQELMLAVPKASLHTDYSTMINSEYCNAASFLKNCYLCFKHSTGEDCAYTNLTHDARDAFEVAYSTDPELCYEIVHCRKSSRTFFSIDCENSQNIYFCRDLLNCTDCFGCTSLRNKSYCFFNEQLTKEEYQKRMAKIDTGTMKNINEYSKRAHELSLKYPRRACLGRNNVNSSGEYLYNNKNAKECYFIWDCENVKYTELFVKGTANNCYDFSAFGFDSEWMYEATWSGWNSSNVKFSVWCYRNHDTEYTFGCHGSEYLFGCVGMNKASYCIFNKQYTKEEYFPLIEKIKKQMSVLPFVDRNGLEHKYGGQIPLDLCPWTYNESTAYEFFPLTKEEAIEKGFTWRDSDPREYLDATMIVPENIKDVKDEILKAILKCRGCGKNYQIIPKELTFLRRFNFPIPDHCPLCRDRARIHKLNPMQRHQRNCAKCQIPIVTSYSPERPEIVFCEKCYQQEVY